MISNCNVTTHDVHRTWGFAKSWKCWYPYTKYKSQRKAELCDTLQLVCDGKFDKFTQGLERRLLQNKAEPPRIVKETPYKISSRSSKFKERKQNPINTKTLFMMMLSFKWHACCRWQQIAIKWYLTPRIENAKKVNRLLLLSSK